MTDATFTTQNVVANLTKLWGNPNERSQSLNSWFLEYQNSNMAWSISRELVQFSDPVFQLMGSQTLNRKLRYSGSQLCDSDLMELSDFLVQFLISKVSTKVVAEQNIPVFNLMTSQAVVDHAVQSLSQCTLLLEANLIPVFLRLASEPNHPMFFITLLLLSELPDAVCLLESPGSLFDSTAKYKKKCVTYLEGSGGIVELIILSLKHVKLLSETKEQTSDIEKHVLRLVDCLAHLINRWTCRLGISLLSNCDLAELMGDMIMKNSSRVSIGDCVDCCISSLKLLNSMRSRPVEVLDDIPTAEDSKGEKIFLTYVVRILEQVANECVNLLVKTDQNILGQEMNIQNTFEMTFSCEFPPPTYIPIYQPASDMNDSTLAHWFTMWTEVSFSLVDTWPGCLYCNETNKAVRGLLYYVGVVSHKLIQTVASLWDKLREMHRDGLLSDALILDALETFGFRYLSIFVMHARGCPSTVWEDEDEKIQFAAHIGDSLCSVSLIFRKVSKGHIWNKVLTDYMRAFISMQDEIGIQTMLLLADSLTKSFSTVPYSFLPFLGTIPDLIITTPTTADALCIILHTVASCFDQEMNVAEMSSACDVISVTAEAYSYERSQLWRGIFNKLLSITSVSTSAVVSALHEITWWGGHNIAADLDTIRQLSSMILNPQLTQFQPPVEGTFYAILLLILYNHSDLAEFVQFSLDVLDEASKSLLNGNSITGEELYRSIFKLQACASALLRAPQDETVHDGIATSLRCQVVIADFSLKNNFLDSFTSLLLNKVFQIPDTTGWPETESCEKFLNIFLSHQTGKESTEEIHPHLGNLYRPVSNNPPSILLLAPISQRLLRTFVFILGSPTLGVNGCEELSELITDKINTAHLALQKRCVHLCLSVVSSAIVSESFSSRPVHKLIQLAAIGWCVSISVEAIKTNRRLGDAVGDAYLAEQLNLTQMVVLDWLPPILKFWDIVKQHIVSNFWGEERKKAFAVFRPLLMLIAELMKRTNNEDKLITIMKIPGPKRVSMFDNGIVYASIETAQAEPIWLVCLRHCAEKLESFDLDVAKYALLGLYYTLCSKRGCSNLSEADIRVVVQAILSHMSLWYTSRMNELWRVVSKLSEKFPEEFICACSIAAGLLEPSSGPIGVFKILNNHQAHVVIECFKRLKGPRIRVLLQDLCSIQSGLLQPDCLLSYEMAF